MPDAPLTVVVADDHAIVRDGLRLLLEDQGRFEVVGEAADAETAVRKVLGHKPDVLVLDLSMPGGSTLEVLEDIAQASPATAVVVLTMQSEPDYARVAMRRGARGYVLKESASGELLQAIDAVVAGGTFVSPSLGARLAESPEERPAPPGGLTRREADVLGLLALGYTNAQVADRLGVSRRTIETHRASLQGKIGAPSRVELVRYAVQHGLIDLAEAVIDDDGTGQHDPIRANP
jgi:two-component system response regulator NreC